VFDSLVAELVQPRVPDLDVIASALADSIALPLEARVWAASPVVRDAAELERPVGLCDAALAQPQWPSQASPPRHMEAFGALVRAINDLAKRGDPHELVAVRAMARWYRAHELSTMTQPIATALLERTGTDRFSGIDAWIAKRSATPGASRD
jgi:hypothetical protein